MNTYNIVLVHPEIPQNTGNIGRLCVSTSTRLHLIEPLGYSLDDKYLKRSGMDYWKHLDLVIYKNWEEFKEKNPEANMYFFRQNKKSFWECPYEDNCFFDFLVAKEQVCQQSSIISTKNSYTLYRWMGNFIEV